MTEKIGTNYGDFVEERVVAETKLAESPPVILIKEQSFAASSTVSVISAQPKAMKTALTAAMIAATFTKNGETPGFPSIKTLANLLKKAVIFIDTEQAKRNQQKIIKSIISRAGLNKTPDNLCAYNTSEWEKKDFITRTRLLCEKDSLKHGGIHLIVIDGIADYIISVNDEAESSAIVKFLNDLAKLYDCPVIAIIHLNPGSNKERGTLGSELQRKCYGLLTLFKKKGVVTATVKMLRDGDDEVSPFYFVYDKEKCYPMELVGKQSVEVKPVIETSKELSIIINAFKGRTTLRYTDLAAYLFANNAGSKTTCDNIIGRNAASKNIIKREKLYHLNSKINQL